jgi:hypothetical protein
LPRPIVIPKIMTLKTLADVRELMRHLPEDGARGRLGATSPRNSLGRLPAPIRSTLPSRFAWC